MTAYSDRQKQAAAEQHNFCYIMQLRSFHKNNLGPVLNGCFDTSSIKTGMFFKSAMQNARVSFLSHLHISADISISSTFQRTHFHGEDNEMLIRRIIIEKLINLIFPIKCL